MFKKPGYVWLLLAFYGCSAAKEVVSLSEKPLPSATERVISVLTYNVLTGFQKNPLQADLFVKWIKRQRPDIVAFQELSTFTQDSLERFAERYGHHYAVLHKGNGSPVGITSRYPFTAVKTISGTMHHGCIYVKTAGSHFFVTHLSPFSYEKCIAEINGIIAMASVLPEKEKIMILGDLNSFSPADSSQYSHRRFNVIQSLLDNGFTDVFRQANGTFENSFPTLKYIQKTKTPNRIDYIFANGTAVKQLVSSVIIKDEVTDSLSDHYPLMATFDQ